MNYELVTFEELVDFVAADGRVAPGGRYWAEFYEILVGDLDNYTGIKDPPVPLILAGSIASNRMKRERLLNQIKYGNRNGKLLEMAKYLMELPATAWTHEGN